MSYDESLAGRIRRLLRYRRGAAEREMFGGLAFLLDGRMCLGIIGEDRWFASDPGDTRKRSQGRTPGRWISPVGR